MKRSIVPGRAVAALALCIASVHGRPARAQLDPTDPETPAVQVQTRVERAFETQERVKVFLILREGAPLADAQQTALELLGAEFTVGRRYRNIPALAGELTRAGLERLRAAWGVAAVQLDGTGSGGLAEAVPAAGVDLVHSMRGLTGEGVTVAILDSGASTRHPALQGAIVGQHCFTQLGCGTFANEGESAEDDHNHGSNVAGIVASRSGGGVAKGYAPAAKIVAVKVLNQNNAGQVSDWVAGFDWVFTNRDMFHVKVINASLVSTAEYGNAAQCDSGETALAMITRKLVDAGITITSSSGNTGHTATMTAPACNSKVIAVGATYDSDLGKQPEGGGTYRSLGGSLWPACSDAATNTTTIACFTSTAGARLDVLAPGTQIKSAGVGTGTSLFRGTSQAAPGVAGLAALMLQCNPMLTPSEILDVLKMTGKPVMDPRSGMTYPLISGLAAVDMACPMGAAGAGGSAAGGAGGASGASGAGSGGSGSGTAGVGGMTGAAGSTAPGMTTAGSSAASAGTAGGSMGTRSGAGGGTAGGGNAGTIGTGGASGRAAGLPLGAGQASATDSDMGCAASGSRGRSSATSAALVAFALAAFSRRRRARTLRANPKP